MARVLIAGCGFLGSALGLRLSGEGHSVWGLRRAAEHMPPGILSLQADLGNPESLENLPPDLDFVFYTAGADSSSEGSYRAAYLIGLENMLSALAAGGRSLRRFFFTSSTAVYGQTAGEWVDEESPAEAENHRGRIMREAEELALGGPFPATAVRMGGIYGPGRGRLIESVRRGEAAVGEGPPRYINRIHRDDCSGIFRFLMGMGGTGMGTGPDALYNGVDSEPAAKCEVVRWLAGRMGAPALPGAERAFQNIRPGEGAGKRCSNVRIRAAGYEFLYPTFRDGYGAILDEEPG